MTTKEQVIEALKKVEDPELMIDVWTLGLIYDIDLQADNLKIKMTFTSPMCPYGPMLVEEMKRKLAETGVKQTDVEVVFNPPWQPSEEVKEILGIAPV
ncbi:MAG: metal-sulfur cluster assembly factor [Candidatus Aenigmarchaeota archaeon]|nr:metal-sulfur cluster assembly factor [Candidatus Aenigmarchaeota archaeon]